MTNKELAHQIAEILTLKGYVDKDNNIVKGASLTFLSTALASELNRILASSPVEDKNICKQDDQPSPPIDIDNIREGLRVLIKLDAGAIIPTYATEDSAGFDIAANFEHISDYELFAKRFNKEDDVDYIDRGGSIMVLPGRTVPIPTGLYFAIPTGYELQIRPRSGMAGKHGLSIINTPGTIDSDYRGEIIVLLHNHSTTPRLINQDDRIAQGVLSPICIANLIPVNKISETDRGSGGFGHTGITINKD
jgi:dUTP pyrophosphatase